jgi:catechol 2,3-dioxygenase-like lactoylglutathione lyase family enzyme
MLGIRHVALRVRDLQRSLDFYTRLLGMHVEWQPDPENAYLSGGSDNLALHQVRNGTAATDASPGLDHIGFAVSKSAEVDHWAELLEAEGVELAQKPRTHRDGARSMYFRDPDGNLIQILYHPHISH